jgi:hypothetical protein
MKRSTAFFGLGLLAAIILLSSCFYPEKFNATLNIDKSGSYNFVYDGTLVFLQFDSEKDEPLLTDQNPQEIKKLAEELKKDPNFQEVKYTGKGRFKVLYRREGVITPNVKTQLLSESCRIISIRQIQPGKVLIKGANLDEVDIEYLKKLNFRLQGKLIVTTNAEVIRHNAERSPWFPGLSKTYEWQFSLSPFPEPWLLLQLEGRAHN